jgi:hypothetical protein
LKNLANRSSQFIASADRRFEFHKRGQLFIRTHNETLSGIAMRISNPDRSPVESIANDIAPTRKTQNVSTCSTPFE